MREKVIIQRIDVTKKSELRTFQIKMPPDAKRIIGFEGSSLNLDSTGNLYNDLPLGLYAFQRSFFLGEIRIQSCEKANLFYSSHIFLTDSNLGFGDFSQTLNWQSKMWIAGTKKQEDIISINECSPIVQGNYRDKFGERLNLDFPYSINLYLWYETIDK